MEILLHPGVLLLLSSLTLYIIQSYRLLFNILAISCPLLCSAILIYLLPHNQIYYFNYIIKISAEYTDFNIALCIYILICTSIINLSLWYYNARDYYITVILSTAYVAFNLISLLSADFATMIYTFEIISIISAIMLFDRSSIEKIKLFYQYLIIYYCSNMLILAGTIMIIEYYGLPTINLTQLIVSSNSSNDTYIACMLILLGLLLRIGCPILTHWLVLDSYSKSKTPIGTYFSMLNIVLNIIWILRLFGGLHTLIFIGIYIGIAGIMYAALEDQIKRSFSHLFIAVGGMSLILIGMAKNQNEIINAMTIICTSYVLFQAFVMITCNLLHTKYKLLKFSDFKKIENINPTLPISIYFAILSTAIVLVRILLATKYPIVIILLCPALIIHWYTLRNSISFHKLILFNNAKNKLNLLEYFVVLCFMIVSIIMLIKCCTILPGNGDILSELISLFIGGIIYLGLEILFRRLGVISHERSYDITASVLLPEYKLYTYCYNRCSWLYNIATFEKSYSYQQISNLLKFQQQLNYQNSPLTQHTLSLIYTILLLTVLIMVSII